MNCDFFGPSNFFLYVCVCFQLNSISMESRAILEAEKRKRESFISNSKNERLTLPIVRWKFTNFFLFLLLLLSPHSFVSFLLHIDKENLMIILTCTCSLFIYQLDLWHHLSVTRRIVILFHLQRRLPINMHRVTIFFTLQQIECLMIKAHAADVNKFLSNLQEDKRERETWIDREDTEAERERKKKSWSVERRQKCIHQESSCFISHRNELKQSNGGDFFFLFSFSSSWCLHITVYSYLAFLSLSLTQNCSRHVLKLTSCGTWKDWSYFCHSLLGWIVLASHHFIK